MGRQACPSHWPAALALHQKLMIDDRPLSGKDGSKGPSPNRQTQPEMVREVEVPCLSGPSARLHRRREV
jgi:hypothetical protein